MSKKLTLEYSIEDIVDFHQSPASAIDKTLRAHEDIQERFPEVEISLLPFARIKSVFTGGRCPKFSQERFLGIAQELNRVKISCMMVLNGGLLLPKDITLNWKDPQMENIKEALDTLANSEVDNAVTLYHDALLDVVDKRYPDLKKTASCIRFVGGKKGEFQTESKNDEYDEYDRTFADKRFSNVVPLNQHTTYEFLQRFKGEAARIMAFLKLHCSGANLYNCYMHYCYTEREQFGVNRDGIVDQQEFVSIKSQIKESLVSPCIGGYLSSRGHDLKDLINMGVNKYKLSSESMAGKTTDFRTPEIEMLLDGISWQK
jgi:hypothetical protein